MNHFTDRQGYNGIRATAVWCFRASQPPGDHLFGAYFTTLSPQTPNLALRLRIPHDKISHMFSFTDIGDLIALRGGRGRFVFYSPRDYEVGPDRQLHLGEREKAP